jgi:hypothetical protein
MGAWGAKAFENDAASDWVAGLEAGGVELLRHALATVAETPVREEVDVDDGSAAIAAAELVAAALGRGRDRVPKRLAAWLDANAADVSAEDGLLARRAVQRVVGGRSELRSLWNEVGPDSEWQADVRVLLARLGASAHDATPVADAHEELADERSKTVLLTFLQARGLEPDDEQMARIVACEDARELRGWLARVVTVSSVDEMLDGSER